jgi:hypothetical protein
VQECKVKVTRQYHRSRAAATGLTQWCAGESGVQTTETQGGEERRRGTPIEGGSGGRGSRIDTLLKEEGEEEEGERVSVIDSGLDGED